MMLRTAFLFTAATGLLATSCGGQATRRPDDNAAGRATPAESELDAAKAPPVRHATPRLCDTGDTETEVMDEILARSGRGLLWLVVPDSEADRKTMIARGAEEVRSARALAECLLRHRDAGFDPTQSKGFDAFVAWVDAHVGPEHAETLLAAGAAYFASLLVAESWIDAALDVPTARLFLERATAAAPQLADGLGPLILGAYECFAPRAMGGQPEAGLGRLQQAAERDGPLQLAMKVAAAEVCAFALQDRALFDRLLHEVDASDKAISPYDLLAKQRAKSLRTEVDDLFPELD
jgi:hypothetical protein